MNPPRDAAYAQRLYEGTTDRLVCYSQDSIAGPVKGCRDERYRADFETMIQNLDKPDLGLGPEHTVEEIAF